MKVAKFCVMANIIILIKITNTNNNEYIKEFRDCRRSCRPTGTLKRQTNWFELFEYYSCMAKLRDNRIGATLGDLNFLLRPKGTTGRVKIRGCCAVLTLSLTLTLPNLRLVPRVNFPEFELYTVKWIEAVDLYCSRPKSRLPESWRRVQHTHR